MKKVVARALNKNQQLILFSVNNNERETLYALLRRLSRSHAVSLSTLKLNARILRDLELLSFNGSVQITGAGVLIKNLLGDTDEG